LIPEPHCLEIKLKPKYNEAKEQKKEHLVNFLEHFLIILLWPTQDKKMVKTIGIIRGDELEHKNH
jgi:hypothetical protein